MSARVLRGVQHIVEDADEYARQTESRPPALPAGSRTPAQAEAALRAAVWWRGRRGVPSIPPGTSGVQDSLLNTAPVAVLGSIPISPGAQKVDLEATQDHVLAAIVGGDGASHGLRWLLDKPKDAG